MDMVVQEEMNDLCDCFILRSVDYKDYDVILTTITKEYGKVAFHASGIRKMNSKNARNTLLYTKSKFLFDYKQNKTIFRLKGANTVQLYRNMHENLKSSLAASVIAEVTDSLMLEGASFLLVSKVFDFVDVSFHYLNEGKDTDTILALYLIDLMKVSGFEPDVDECTICGSTRVSSISSEEGGFLCETCARLKHKKLMPVERLKRFRLLVKAGLAYFDLVENFGGATKEDLEILVDILRKHAGIGLKSFLLYTKVSD